MTRFITPKQACERIAVSRSTLDRMVADGTFPKPLRLTERRLAYVEADVEAWMTEKLNDIGLRCKVPAWLRR